MTYAPLLKKPTEAAPLRPAAKPRQPSRPLMGSPPVDENSDATLRRKAAEAVSGATAPLPFAAEIQRSFGPYDVASINATTGGRAVDLHRTIGASAHVLGESVAFSRTPNLRVAAHEAAHVIQQRAGVNLQGGVGRPGDAHERGADAVADAVVEGRSARPLLDSFAGTRARLAPRPALTSSASLQFYFEKKNWGGHDWRIADDLRMAVRQDDPVVGGRHCYADPALIARANKLLAAQKSDLEITADKEELALPASERGVARLRRVRPKNRRNKTEGNARAGGMLLVDDCGDAAHSIMHGSGRKTQGVYNRIGEFAPGCWLDERQAPRSRGRLQIPTPAKTAAYQYGEKFGPVHQSPDMMMEDIYAGASGRPFAKAWPEYLQKRRSVPLGADDDFATSMRRRLEANDSFDAMAGINRFARPETGEAYSIVAQNYSGIAWGDNAPWNFHWGAVILKSGGDSITLENFANSGEDAWNYQMYGPPTKEGQTFHEQQMIRQDGDVPGYGLNPTTIRVRSSER